MVYFSHMIWWFSFPDIYPVSGFFPGFFRIFIKCSDIFIEWMVYCTSHIWLFFSGKLSGFRIFFSDFSAFSSYLQIHSFIIVYSFTPVTKYLIWNKFTSKSFIFIYLIFFSYHLNKVTNDFWSRLLYFPPCT